ncbi:hypothetical protein P5706_35510 [Pseudomonas sp. ChxA]|uniref:hypothetical protein n=1 Tax=Pseudomonas TaxID=286 RepID=UPI0009972DA0|nr:MULTISPECIES: hypothetical protein [Pseudomonas]MBJ2203352.1 hypothetical protein [Pseudomonas carnis]MBX9409296.1 hypothetical protein [Pseudomonas baetica]MDL2189482.1 hypothetical protein [Pseudomonas sp. ChxA]OOW06910.1 hypothetical protein MF6394_01215 [Pseudomonas sp. MF6394]
MKKIVLTVAAMAMAAAAYAALQRPDDVQALATAQVEDSDTVRLAIGKAFIADPKSFDLPAASTRLGKARLEGYAVCTQSAEATAAQYIEVSQMLDSVANNVQDFQRVIDGVMESKSGMSDCDFRVIVAMAQANKGI